MIYLMGLIIEILCRHPQNSSLEQAVKYSTVIKCQLDLMETFVDDLLDLT